MFELEFWGCFEETHGDNPVLAICNVVPYGVLLFALTQKVTKKVKAVENFGWAVGRRLGAQSKTRFAQTVDCFFANAAAHLFV